MTLDFEPHSNRALLARPGPPHARQVLSLRDGRPCRGRLSTCCRSCSPVKPQLEGDFRWMPASVVPLGGFHSMGRTKRPVFVCQPNMRQHMQQLQQHCLELWTRRLSTPPGDAFIEGAIDA